jgi:hypothetical protein
MTLLRGSGRDPNWGFRLGDRLYGLQSAAKLATMQRICDAYGSVPAGDVEVVAERADPAADQAPGERQSGA